jgi:hypothetical protein
MYGGYGRGQIASVSTTLGCARQYSVMRLAGPRASSPGPKREIANPIALVLTRDVIHNVVRQVLTFEGSLVI